MHGKKRTGTEQELRFGVIGVGGMGQQYCRILQDLPRAKLAAVCDVFKKAADEAGKQFGVPAFSDHHDLIAARCCDVVTIVTPHPFHAVAAVDCMRAGLHVITEKPLTERVSTADKMIAAARKHRVTFAVMFQMRLAPVFKKALDIVNNGELGRIYRTALFVHSYRSQRYYDSGNWRATWKGEGGGVLINQAPHMLDLFVQLGGMPSELYGRTETLRHHIEVEDYAEALLRYKNGARGYVCCSTNETGPGNMIEIFGDKGKLIIRDQNLEFYRFATPIGEHMQKSDDIWAAPEAKPVKLKLRVESGKSKHGHRVVLENVIRHILSGRPLATPGASGLGSLELANAITLSSHEKKWIKLPIDRKLYDRLLARLQRNSSFVKRNVKAERKTDPRLA